MSCATFQKILDEYINNHYVSVFDDINVISNLQKFPNQRKRQEYVIMNQFRLYTALSYFNRYFFEGMNVLDIGCFPGMLLRLLKIAYQDKIDLFGAGLMLSREFVELFSAKYSVEFAQANLDPFLSIKEADLLKDVPTKLEWQNSKFDFIFATEILEHLFTPTVILQESFRLLRPGGYIYITTPNLASLPLVISMLSGNSAKPLGVNIEGVRTLWRPHVRLYTLSELKNILEHNGFQIVEARYYDDKYDEYYVRDNYQKIKYQSGKIFCMFFKRYKPNLLILAQKPN